MLDVACGFRPSPRAAFLRRDLERIASLSAFYRKLNRMELAVTEAIVRHTAARARQLIVAGGGLLPEPIPGYAARILDGNVLTGTEHRIDAAAHDLVGRPARHVAGGLRAGQRLDPRPDPRGGRPHPGAGPARPRRRRARPALDHGSQLLRPLAAVPDRAGRRRSSWSAGTLDAAVPADQPAAAGGAAAPPARIFEQPIEVDRRRRGRPPACGGSSWSWTSRRGTARRRSCW